MADENDIDAFINHKTNNSSFASYLSGWKEKGQVDTWLHTKCMPVPVWRHQIPLLKPIEDRDSKETHVMLWSENAVCHEAEEILRAQYSRDDKGMRSKPPTKCGICLLIEWVYQQVQEQELDWKDPIFHFKGESRDKRTGKYSDTELILHAGGLYNAFSRVDDDDEKKELKEAGIFLKEAWKENALAKCNYVFRVVDNDLPKDGVQIAIEAASLGDKVKTVIADRMTSKGREAGNPLRNPYCIRWKYNEKEKEFGKKYHALVMENVELTTTIKELIYGNAPSIDHLRDPFTSDTVRSFLERHCVIKGVPWDKLFVKGSGGKSASSNGSNGKTTTAGAEAEKASAKPKEEKKGKVHTTSTGIEIADDDAVACDKCSKPMNIAWNKCVECGTVYQGDGLKDPPEVVRRRSAAVASKKEKASAKEPDPEPEDDEDKSEHDEDHIPFD